MVPNQTLLCPFVEASGFPQTYRNWVVKCSNFQVTIGTMGGENCTGPCLSPGDPVWKGTGMVMSEAHTRQEDSQGRPSYQRHLVSDKLSSYTQHTQDQTQPRSQGRGR